MHKFTLTTQASRTLLLLVLTHLNCFQFSCTSHCIMISNTHAAVNLARSKLNFSNLYISPYYKTRNSNKYICYATNINVYELFKLTTVLLVPSTNFSQLGSETRTPRSRSRCIDGSSDSKFSSPEKPSYKGGKSRMTPATAASPKHTQNNTKDEHKHLQKFDKRSKQKESRTNRPTQVNARRKPGIQLRGQMETDEIWRPHSSRADQMKGVQTTCIAHRENGSTKSMDQRAEDPERMNQHTKPRPWRDKGGPKLERDNFQLHRTISGKLSNPSSCKKISTHMNNLPLVNNKNINKKTQNRDNHYENSQLTRQKNMRKASLAKKRIWKIIDLKTCRQWSRRGITSNQHKKHEPKISSKPKIRNNQLRDVSGSTASHAMTIHDPHNAAHDVAIERHEEKERPKKTSNASHARCTTAIRRETITNKKSGHLKTNLPEVEALVELWRRRRGRPEVLVELWRRRRGRPRT